MAATPGPWQPRRRPCCARAAAACPYCRYERVAVLGCQLDDWHRGDRATRVLLALGVSLWALTPGSVTCAGEGIVYSYDAVGCFEKMKYTVSGSGQALIEPFLDNMVAYKNTDKKPATERYFVSAHAAAAAVLRPRCLSTERGTLSRLHGEAGRAILHMPRVCRFRMP